MLREFRDIKEIMLTLRVSKPVVMNRISRAKLRREYVTLEEKRMLLELRRKNLNLP